MALDVELKEDMPAKQVLESVRRIESAIRGRFERVRRIYIESSPQAVQRQEERLGASHEGPG